MADILAFKLKPVIRVDQLGGLWGVSIRPCPDDQPSLKSFDNSRDAAAYATALKAAHGWRIYPERFDLTPDNTMDGAA